jgi:hypothetical protein
MYVSTSLVCYHGFSPSTPCKTIVTSLFPSVCVPSWLLFLHISSMPPLKETYLQIQDRNRREIRNRTYARLAQLAQEAENNRQGSRSNQQEEETNTPLPTPSLFTSSTDSVPLHTHSSSPSLLHIHINHSPEAQLQQQDYRLWLVVFLLVLLLLGQFRFLLHHEPK